MGAGSIVIAGLLMFLILGTIMRRREPTVHRGHIAANVPADNSA